MFRVDGGAFLEPVFGTHPSVRSQTVGKTDAQRGSSLRSQNA